MDTQTATSQSRTYKHWRLTLCVLFCLQAVALAQNGDVNDFADLSIEELMNIEVTSVTGQGEAWFTTPAAIHVITNEDLRRTGHRQLAEALRMVPGMNVARLNSNTWAINARGLNNRFTRNLLVLIDGRQIYDPLFGGTLWDIQDVIMEDIDRIEVIRGPGATLWGANAVNGVINITTRSAKDTQGLYLNAGVGTEDRGLLEARYGGKIGDNVYYRVWGRWADHDATVSTSGNELSDDWDMSKGGLRFDIDGADGAVISVQGEVYHGDRIGQDVRIPVPTGHFASTVVVNDTQAAGGHLLFNIDKPLDNGGWELRGYYDRTHREFLPSVKVKRDTLEIDFRHYFDLGDTHSIMWGASWQYTTDETQAGASVAFVDSDRESDVFAWFLQDEITLIPDKLTLLIGSKFESNDYTGFEYQPSARLSWTPSDRHHFWGAVSRPIRRPTRFDDDVAITAAFVDTGLIGGGPPSGIIVPLSLLGSADIESEELIAYELGYRAKVAEQLTFDVAFFFNDYRKLSHFSTTGVPTVGNRASGETYGAEFSASWRVADNWRLEASYSFHRVQIHGDSFLSLEGDSPRNQFQIRSYYDITKDIELNAALYYVDNVPNQTTDSYVRLDLGVTWRPTPNLELSVWGQNLFEESHKEGSDVAFLATPHEIERSVYFQMTLRF